MWTSARAVAKEAEAAGHGRRRAGLGRRRRGGGRHADLHGRRQDAAFATAQPLFEIMGQKAVHCGPAGNGQAAKICNNMILGVTMIATCEAFALADKLGLDRQAMFDVVSTSSGYSWTMNAYCPAPGIGPTSPADNDYKPGFAADLMLKDLRLSQQAAKRPTPTRPWAPPPPNSTAASSKTRTARARLLRHAAAVREKRPHRRHLTGRKGGSDFS
jgi:3-hydroxyisobutyrate dehydrogenase